MSSRKVVSLSDTQTHLIQTKIFLTLQVENSISKGSNTKTNRHEISLIINLSLSSVYTQNNNQISNLSTIKRNNH